jgi:hypothetical protein
MAALQEALNKISSASNLEELKACEAQCRALPEDEKSIARWSYAYAREQLTGSALASG